MRMGNPCSRPRTKFAVHYIILLSLFPPSPAAWLTYRLSSSLASPSSCCPCACIAHSPVHKLPSASPAFSRRCRSTSRRCARLWRTPTNWLRLSSHTLTTKHQVSHQLIIRFPIEIMLSSLQHWLPIPMICWRTTINAQMSITFSCASASVVKSLALSSIHFFWTLTGLLWYDLGKWSVLRMYRTKNTNNMAFSCYRELNTHSTLRNLGTSALYYKWNTKLGSSLVQ